MVQVFKIFVLARVTPAALRQLLSSTHMAGTSSSTSAGSAAIQAQAAAAATGVTPIGQHLNPAGKAGPAAPAATLSPEDGSPQAGSSSVDANGAKGGINVPDGSYAVPPDEVLSSSNIYSTAEACLLAWMSAHMARAFPHLVSRHCLAEQHTLPGLLGAVWESPESSASSCLLLAALCW